MEENQKTILDTEKNSSDNNEFSWIKQDLIKKKKNNVEKKAGFIDILKLFSPGTPMRTALDDIKRAEMGALIVIDKEGLSEIIEKGFRINCEFSAQKLVELAKMDGSIILSKDFKKILYANALLAPKMNIRTKETGTRHKAAERTSKQIKTIVVAISERRNKITVYWGDESYVLENSSEILRRATESLQILEKQKEIFNDLLSHLNILEITNFVTISDVCKILQRMEMMRKISDFVRRYLVELGKEGVMVSIRLKELTANLDKERKMILSDYFEDNGEKADLILHDMNFDFLLEASNLSRILFEELHDKKIPTKGFRILSKTNLLEKDIKILLDEFGSLKKVFSASRDDILKIIKNEGLVDSLIQDIKSIKESISAGKRI